MASISRPEPNLIALKGEVDLHDSPAIKAAFAEIFEAQPPKVLVDLSEVSYIDSSGLAVLIEAMQKTHAYGGLLALFGIKANVKTVFQISRLDQVFKIYDDKATALAG